MQYRMADIFDVVPITMLWTKLVSETQVPFIVADSEEIENFAYAITGRMKLKDAATLLAIEDGRIVGFMHGYVLTRPYGKPRTCTFIEHLYVDKEFRSPEVMDNMVTWFEEWSRNLGVKRFEFISKSTAWERKGHTKFMTTYIGDLS